MKIKELAEKYKKAQKAISILKKEQHKAKDAIKNRMNKKAYEKATDPYNYEDNDLSVSYRMEDRVYYSKDKIKNAFSSFLSDEKIEKAMNQIPTTTIDKVYIKSKSAYIIRQIDKYLKKIEI